MDRLGGGVGSNPDVKELITSAVNGLMETDARRRAVVVCKHLCLAEPGGSGRSRPDPGGDFSVVLELLWTVGAWWCVAGPLLLSKASLKPRGSAHRFI